jgi:putative ABC transport system ATP-binding protein
MMKTIIEARGLKRYYTRGSEIVKAVDGIDLDVFGGEMLSVLGPSGSGKTTLIHLLSCLDAPTGGSLVVDGRPVASLSEDELACVRRRRIGFVFQKFYLLPTLTVAENVGLPLLFLKEKPDPGAIAEVLRRVGIEDRATHLPGELSGGQMQRVAIARALVVRPKVLIADEPTGNLDSENAHHIFELFRALVREQGISVLITTHNLALGYLADRIITLSDGRVVKEEAGPR